MATLDEMWRIAGVGDAALAGEVAARLGLRALPASIVSGVAANARLLRRHLDLLRGEAR